jgi:phage terminase large subunit-like protein
MTDPTKELERLIQSRKLRHGGHPVLRWMADCLEVSTDPAGNIKPVKPNVQRSAKRIDGIVSLVMGLSRAMLLGANPPTDRSIYEEQELRIV